MAGRIDNAAQQAAVTKVSEVAPYEDEIRSHLDQILASSAFSGSRRAQEFLSHVVEHALSGDFNGIKERILGIRIFGREASYDTGYDSIVRVTASDVRKRLLRYYKTSASSALRIELRSGSYIPEFHHVVGEPAYSPLTISNAGSAPESNPIPGRSLEVVAPSPDGPVVTTSEPGEDRSGLLSGTASQRLLPVYQRMLVALLAASLCLVFLFVGWRIGLLHGGSAVRLNSSIDARYSFYKELLGPIATDPQQETKIVLSNPSLLLYRGSDSPTSTIDADKGKKKIEIPQALAHNFTGGESETQGGSPYHYLALDTTDYTGLGEAQTAFNLRKLFDLLNGSAQLTEARFLNWDEARDQHLVLLGARHMSPWAQTNLITANFKMDHDVIYNNRPKPGEQPFYAPRFDGRVLVDYGLIWMSQSSSGSRILVLAGLTSTGTAGVGNFFIDPNQMKPIFEKLKATSPNGSIPANWQVLLRITARDDVPLNVSFVSLRVANPNP